MTDIAVAGHICLDIIPHIPADCGGAAELLTPGRLTQIGPAVTATGGAVPNVGLALHRLGLAPLLIGKIGDDALGQVVLGILAAHDPALAQGMVVAPGEPTSYTIVVNLPGADRSFLHCPGVNDTFVAADIPYSRLAATRCVHFGYPPLMRRIAADNGKELIEMMRRLKQAGATTSLDMSYVDPASEAGRVDWPALLRGVLPHVDIFLPSLDEILVMLGSKTSVAQATARDLGAIADTLIGHGAAVVGLKLGEQGLFLQTTADERRFGALGRARPADGSQWLSRQMLAPCFQAQVRGTTGAGDCTIAGFLAGLVKGLPPQEALTMAVAIGACCVEAADATSGILPWGRVQDRIAAGWPRRQVSVPMSDWRWDPAAGLWLGPRDQEKL